MFRSRNHRQLPPIFGAISILIIAVTSSCSDSDTNPLSHQLMSPFEGITVTDEVGNISSFDPDDWCIGILTDQVLIRPEIRYMHSVSKDIPAQGWITILNHSGSSIDIGPCYTDYPFSVSPTNLSLQSGQLDSILVQYTPVGISDDTGSVYIPLPASQETLSVGLIRFVRSLDSIIVTPEGDSVMIDLNPCCPYTLSLEPARPNPFTQTTMLTFVLDKESDYLIRVSDGSEDVYTLQGHLEAGNHHILWDAGNLPPGIYRVYAEVGDWSCHGDVQKLNPNQ